MQPVAWVLCRGIFNISTIGFASEVLMLSSWVFWLHWDLLNGWPLHFPGTLGEALPTWLLLIPFQGSTSGWWFDDSSVDLGCNYIYMYLYCIILYICVNMGNMMITNYRFSFVVLTTYYHIFWRFPKSSGYRQSTGPEVAEPLPLEFQDFFPKVAGERWDLGRNGWWYLNVFDDYLLLMVLNNAEYDLLDAISLSY